MSSTRFLFVFTVNAKVRMHHIPVRKGQCLLHEKMIHTLKELQALLNYIKKNTWYLSQLWVQSISLKRWRHSRENRVL